MNENNRGRAEQRERKKERGWGERLKKKQHEINRLKSK